MHLKPLGNDSNIVVIYIYIALAKSTSVLYIYTLERVYSEE